MIGQYVVAASFWIDPASLGVPIVVVMVAVSVDLLSFRYPAPVLAVGAKRARDGLAGYLRRMPKNAKRHMRVLGKLGSPCDLACLWCV